MLFKYFEHINNKINKIYNETIFLSETSGSRASECEDGCLLGSCAVYSSESLPTFQRYLLLRHQGDVGRKHL
jgi:hypothetical protein